MNLKVCDKLQTMLSKYNYGQSDLQNMTLSQFASLIECVYEHYYSDDLIITESGNDIQITVNDTATDKLELSKLRILQS